MNIDWEAHYFRWQHFRLDWNSFWAMYGSYNRINDLEGLMTWAKRKRLTDVKAYYYRLWIMENERLSHYAIKHIHLARLIYFLYDFITMVWREKKSYSRTIQFYKLHQKR